MPNIYMGANSNAKIPSNGRVDSDIELLRNTYATAYDSVNQWVLSPNKKLLKTTPQRIRGRFSVLHRLSKKYAPEKKSFVSAMEKLALANANGSLSDRSYLESIRKLSMREGVDTRMLDMIEAKINASEMRSKQSNVFGFDNFFVGKKQKPVLGFQNFLGSQKGTPSFFQHLNKYDTLKKNTRIVKPFVSPQKQAALFAPNFLKISKGRKSNLKGKRRQDGVFPLNPFFKDDFSKGVLPNLGASFFATPKQKKMLRKQSRQGNPFAGFANFNRRGQTVADLTFQNFVGNGKKKRRRK